MFTSSADVFRTRQAVSDLHDVVHFHRDAVERLGRHGADRAALEAVVSAGGVFADDNSRVYSAVLQAAAMPDDDFNSFIVGTAILLLDRIQMGGGTDDLYWNYDAFRDHYCLADPPVRAALMNGFRTAERQGVVKLHEAPRAEECLTRQPDDVIRMLEAGGDQVLLNAIREETSSDLAGRLWMQAPRSGMDWTARAGFRLLYERPESMSPEMPETAPLLPWY